ncbi:MAG: multidrug resistance protein [Anaerolineae bacterium]|jgi:drug/metabolite transporter (DMT)-like permease|nr:multidrug resistance protein [Anaerolineae bacterium]
MTKTILLILFDVLVSVAGQLTLKRGMMEVGKIDAAFFANPLAGIWRMFTTTPLVLLGLAMYGVGAFIWLIVLSRANLSYAYPMIALTYVLVPLAAWLFLNEPAIPPLRWAGMALIIVGVALVAQS